MKLLFERGAFSSESTLGTSNALWIYGLGLITLAMDQIVNQAAIESADPARGRPERAELREQRVRRVAARETDRRLELAEVSPTMLTVPWLAGDIHDLAGLASLAGHLRRATS